MKRKVVVITDCYDIAAAEIRAKIISECQNDDYEIEPIVPVYPLSVLNSAFSIRLLIDQYPSGTIFQLLCSPTKGIHERLVVRTKNNSFIVAGNHGSLTFLIDDDLIEEVVFIPRDGITTFGGRDVYAKYVGLLLNNKNSILSLPNVKPFQFEKLKRIDNTKNKVLHIDNFGLVKVDDRNEGRFNPGDIIKITINNKKEIFGVFSKRFMELDDGIITVYEGSSLNGLLEIAVVRKNTADELGIHLGDEVKFEKMNTQIKAIFFDLSGTLIDRDIPKLDLQTFIKKSGISITTEEFNKVFNEVFLRKEVNNIEEVVEELNKILKPRNKDYFFLHQTVFLSALISIFTIKKEMVEIIKDLRNKYKIGLLSNTDSLTYNNIDANLISLFDYQLPSFATGNLKPELASYEEILEVTGLAPHEILIVGDNDKKDLSKAREVGMSTILFINPEKLIESMTLYNLQLK